MNNLGFYIREALVTRDKIYLPEIGMFTKERIPAYFDEPNGVFVPPSLNVTLSEGKLSDPSFIHFLAKKENLSLKDAQFKYEQTLQILDNAFKGREEITLESFGKLRKQGDRYEFSYAPTGNLFEEYEPVPESDIIESVAPNKEEIVSQPLPLLFEENSGEGTLVEEIPDESKVPSKRWLWPAIAIAICVVFAGFWFLKPTMNSGSSSDTELTAAGSVPEQKPDTTPLAEAPKSSAQDSLTRQNSVTQDSLLQDSVTAANDPLIQETESVNDLIREPQGKFEIIIAAFNTMEEAEEYVKKTNAKGHRVYILKNNRPTNLNKISYSSFNTEKEATLALEKVRKELTSEAWIYQSKKLTNNN